MCSQSSVLESMIEDSGSVNMVCSVSLSLSSLLFFSSSDSIFSYNSLEDERIILLMDDFSLVVEQNLVF